METKHCSENREVLPSQKSGNHPGLPFSGNRKLMQGQEVISDFQLYNKKNLFKFRLFVFLQELYKR